MTTDTSRMDGLINREVFARTSVLVAGAGSIGSNCVHMLVSMGIRDITVVDGDIVEQPNIAPAFFNSLLIGLPKVEALKRDIYMRFGVNIATIEEMIDTDTQFDRDRYNVVLVGPDSMEARQTIWSSMLGMWDLWIDAAMGGVQGFVSSLREDDDCGAYLGLLQRPNSHLPCGEKAFPPICKGLIPWIVGTSIWRYSKGLPPISASYDADSGYVAVSTPGAEANGYGSWEYAISGNYESSESS